MLYVCACTLSLYASARTTKALLYVPARPPNCYGGVVCACMLYVPSCNPNYARVAPCRTYSRTHYRGVVRVRVFYVPTCIPVCYMQRRCIRARALYLCVPARTPNCAHSTRTLQRHCTCARDVRTRMHTNALRARTAEA